MVYVLSINTELALVSSFLLSVKFAVLPSCWCLQLLDSACWVMAEFNRANVTRAHTEMHIFGLASQHNGLRCWSLPFCNWAQKLGLCLAVIEEAGACSSLMTRDGEIESFMVDLMNKGFTSCYYCLRAIISYNITWLANLPKTRVNVSFSTQALAHTLWLVTIVTNQQYFRFAHVCPTFTVVQLWLFILVYYCFILDIRYVVLI